MPPLLNFNTYVIYFLSKIVEHICLHSLHKYVIIYFIKLVKGGIIILEYTILRINNGGAPFRLCNYSTLEDAKNDLYNMISLEKERNRAYYVDNDFFDNEFPYSVQHCKYFCIQQREITEWNKYTKIKQNRNNIIYFNKSC